MPKPAPPARGLEYVIGVMKMDVESKSSERFEKQADAAVGMLSDTLQRETDGRVELLSFAGPHLTPAGGAYAPLDFLKVGMTEKLERDVHFLLIVTEVDLAATTLSYTLALPSQLTNIGVVSTKRLGPGFWGEEADEGVAVARLYRLLLHTFGHLLNLPHVKDPENVMYDFQDVEDLDAMAGLSEAQFERMRRALPLEAHERTSEGNRWGFIWQTLHRDWRSIAHAVVRANPLRLLARLPTMITAALSVIIVVFFSPEMWDVASTVELYQLVLFSGASLVVATFVLYRAFSFGPLLRRGRRVAESSVVTGAATLLSLLLTLLLLFAAFAGLAYLGILTIFPRKLMETWPTVDPAVRTLDHVKLSLFVAALGTLAGSLGGRADSRDLIRDVLFLDEET